MTRRRIAHRLVIVGNYIGRRSLCDGLVADEHERNEKGAAAQSQKMVWVHDAEDNITAHSTRYGSSQEIYS